MYPIVSIVCLSFLIVKYDFKSVGRSSRLESADRRSAVGIDDIGIPLSQRDWNLSQRERTV